MTKEMEKISLQDVNNVDEVVDDLTLFDDNLMSRVFDNNIEATELLLRIILDKNIKVISVVGQDEMKNHDVNGRNITLDVHAIDEDGKEINIEVQGNSEGAHVKRARFHSSMMDSRMLKSGQEFKELKDSHVIFIYKRDKFRKGLPMYHVDRYVKEMEEPFGDGSHIIYVNGSYNGNDEVGQLMRDFRQSNSKNIHYKELARGVEHYKETKEGRENMSKKLEQYINEKVLCATMQNVKNLMDGMKISLEQALNVLDIKGENRVIITKRMQK